MKRYLILIFVIPMFLSCGKSKEEIRLEKMVDSLQGITTVDQASINEYLRAFNQIQSNLNEIKEKENIITTKTVGDVELEDTDVESINNDILAIYELMQENKKKLSYLRNKLNKTENKNKELLTTINLLNNSIAQKDVELNDLKAQLAQKNFDITELNKKIEEMDKELANITYENISKDSTISTQENELNTAFYIVDSKKILKEKGIILSDGGFIGIGGSTKIQLKENLFEKIDIRNDKEIDLKGSSKIELISSHPEGSYDLQKDSKGNYSKLVISNPESFWKMSKYLVISTR
jgi:predicted  nucleic acid-binding Zn-ribbon protein